MRSEMIFLSKVHLAFQKRLYADLVTGDMFGLRVFVPVINSPARLPQKAAQFQRWLDRHVKEQIHSPEVRQRIRSFLSKSLTQGVRRSYELTGVNLKLAGILRQFYYGKKAQFIDQIVRSPDAAIQLENLFTRDWEELSGLSNNLKTQLQLELGKGVMSKKSPLQIYKQLQNLISQSNKRAHRNVRTAIVRAHAEGQLLAFESLGINKLRLQVERLATKDHPVCPECTKLSKRTFTIAQARGVIPVHHNCRCIWIPA